MKIVINKCYGGYGLSSMAVLRYADLAGITIYLDHDGWCDHYYTVPVAEYKKLYEQAVSTGDHSKINGLYFSEYSIERNDPLLIQVVEELGERSWGEYAELHVVEIPDGVSWEINKYGGMEHIGETHRTWG